MHTYYIVFILFACAVAMRPHTDLKRTVDELSSLGGHHQPSRDDVATSDRLSSIEWAVAFDRTHDDAWFRTFAADIALHVGATRTSASAFQFERIAHKNSDTRAVAIFSSADGVPHNTVATVLAAEQRRVDAKRAGVVWFERQHQRTRGRRSVY